MTRNQRLAAVLGANLVLVTGLVFVGVQAHSLGVLAEGADYLADAAGVGVALLALSIARRQDGNPRATRYAAAINAGWLLVLCLLVVGASAHRLITGTRGVHGRPVLIVSAIAAAVMIASALLLGGDLDDLDELDGPDGNDDGLDHDRREHENLAVRAVLLDTIADAAAAAGVAAAGAVILVTGSLYWLDPAVALAISLAVAWQATHLLFAVWRALRA